MEFLRQKHNQIKFELLENAIYTLRKNDKSRRITLLDLGVGRANDIHKWRKLEIQTVIGVDSDKRQLEEARKRINQNETNRREKGVDKTEVIPCSIQLHEFDLSDSKHIFRLKELLSSYTFDIVCSFFSVHYFIENLYHVLQSVHLSRDCVFLTTFMPLRTCMFLIEPYYENEYIYIKKLSNDKVSIQFKDTPYFTSSIRSNSKQDNVKTFESIETSIDKCMIFHQLSKIRSNETSTTKSFEAKSFVKYYENINSISNDQLIVELMHMSIVASF